MIAMLIFLKHLSNYAVVPYVQKFFFIFEEKPQFLTILFELVTHSKCVLFLEVCI